MAAHPNLTHGAIMRAQNGDNSGQPVVQIIDVKRIQNA